MLEIKRYVEGDRIVREIHVFHGGQESYIVYDSEPPEEKEEFEWFPKHKLDKIFEDI